MWPGIRLPAAGTERALLEHLGIVEDGVQPLCQGRTTSADLNESIPTTIASSTYYVRLLAPTSIFNDRQKSLVALPEKQG
jgi:hypothetical protein